ncbi:MBL fold metallo-hydrolase [Pseudactinotalea sp. HY158]|uniref:MBL fold metallo-hydrolase n=1 Tax=Pseudactinotalea sp. HY158 TaxID=2654547 RepID=UPI00129C752C|nr:MBL fold metallo-hydrolase [Pseudactinotalea sp. HY158]QGH70628.1 MBL fold metallo-hydrolase [Pseudactinotalea sp. HY158]
MFPSLRPGDAPVTTTSGGLRITKIAVDYAMNNNAYLLECVRSGERALIDAAAEPDVLLEAIGLGALATVVTTHAHWDHHRALAAVVRATDAAVVAGAADAAEITAQTSVIVDRAVTGGDVVMVGDVPLAVVSLVGHTPGSIALIHRPDGATPHAFTGDSLFPGGVGNTHGDPAAFASLLAGVRATLFDELPDEAVVHPGHGDDTTLGAERGSLDEWERRGW